MTSWCFDKDLTPRTVQQMDDDLASIGTDDDLGRCSETSEFEDTELLDAGSNESHNEKDRDDAFDPDWFLVPISICNADETCVKLNDLVQRGLIPHDRIFYKYLKDAVCCLTDPNHQYDSEVIEFYNTIEHLGGESTVNFLRGLMYHGSGRGGTKKPEEAKPNLGGPSKMTRQKQKGGYTTKSGVLKSLHLAFLKLATEGSSKVSPVIDTNFAKVVGAAMQDDGTALQPGIEFEKRLKFNVRLKQTVDLQNVKDNPSPSPEFLKENVITEANVSFLTTLCDTLTMPVAVEYFTRAGKTGHDMLNMFTKQTDVLQCCKLCVEKTSASMPISQCNGNTGQRTCEACWD